MPWRFGYVPVIGLVGGMGAGKSRVAQAFAERGAHVLDADQIGHALLDQKPARDAVAKRFGAGVLDGADSGRIDRRALGRIVFADRSALRALEQILHPRMRLTFEKAIARVVRRRSAKAVVLDAAILFEAGWDDLCDRVVFVDAPRSERLRRLADSRGWTADELDARERVQMPLEEKRRRSAFVISTGEADEPIETQVDRVWRELNAARRRHSALVAGRDGADDVSRASEARTPKRRVRRARGDSS